MKFLCVRCPDIASVVTEECFLCMLPVCADHRCVATFSRMAMGQLETKDVFCCKVHFPGPDSKKVIR